jgi:hypothetical protein
MTGDSDFKFGIKDSDKTAGSANVVTMLWLSKKAGASKRSKTAKRFSPMNDKKTVPCYKKREAS